MNQSDIIVDLILINNDYRKVINVILYSIPEFNEIRPNLKHFHGMLGFTGIKTGWNRWERVNKKIDKLISVTNT